LTLVNSKVFLHPAPFESFGIAVADSMAAGAIPVVHDSGGSREFVPSC